MLCKAVKELLEGDTQEQYPLYAYGNNGEAMDGFFKNNAVDLTTCLKKASSDDLIYKPGVGFFDKLFYIYTSGTTGLPKAAIIKHARLVTKLRGIISLGSQNVSNPFGLFFRYFMMTHGSHSIHGIKASDVVYTALPLYHSAGNILGIGHAIIFGASVAFRKKFSASNFWKDCIRYNATVIFCNINRLHFFLMLVCRSRILPKSKVFSSGFNLYSLFQVFFD